MNPLKQFFRVLTRPTHVALAETIGDYCDGIAAGFDRPVPPNPQELTQLMRLIGRFDLFISNIACESKRETLRIATEHWAARIAKPGTVEDISALFANPRWFQSACLALTSAYAGGGSGLAFFQQALKDASLISIPTLREESGVDNAGQSR